MQESIYRAAVSEFTPISSRGAAYRIFNTAYGVGFLISGGIFGLLLVLCLVLVLLPFTFFQKSQRGLPVQLQTDAHIVEHPYKNGLVIAQDVGNRLYGDKKA